MKKRFFSIFTALALLFSTLPVNALAVGNSGAGGLCEHHPSHTAECGYAEGAEGTPCNHEHTEDCYTLVEKCVHEHTDECYPKESVSGNTATSGNAEEQEPTECAHECSEDTGCIKKELDCQHEHDDNCGYIPATKGTPCTFVCAICGEESTEQEENTKAKDAKCICESLCTGEKVNADCPVCGVEDADLTLCKGEPEQAQNITITGFDELPEEVQAQIVPVGTKLADLNLPDTLGASGYVGTQDSGGAEPLTIEGVEWESNPAYDENAEGSWLFTAKLPENYTLLDGVELPQIGVMAEAVNLLAEVTAPGGEIGANTSADDIVNYFGGAATVDSNTKIITLTQNAKVTLADTIDFTGGEWNLNLNGATMKGTEAKAAISVHNSGSKLTIIGKGTIMGGDGGSGAGGNGIDIFENTTLVIEGNAELMAYGGAGVTGGHGVRVKHGTLNNNGTIIATGGTGTGQGGIGFSVFYGNVTGLGAIDATGGDGKMGYLGINIDSSTVTCENLTAQGGNSSKTGGTGVLVTGDNPSLSVNGTLTATGGKGNSGGVGMKCFSNPKVSAGAFYVTGGSPNGTAFDSDNNTHTVIFNADGDTPTSLQFVQDGGKITKPADPLKAGFKFLGWFDSSDKEWNFDDGVTGNLTLTAHWTADTPTPADKYEVKVEKAGNGTASASPASAKEGETIILTAKADSGYHFERWEVVSGGVTISDDSFKMPANDVTVKVIFEKNDTPTPPATKYTVTVNGSYSTTSGEGSYEADKTVTIDAGSRSNYRFNGWTSSDGITFADAGSPSTTFTMPGKDVAVTANWKYTGGGSSGGNTGGGNTGGDSGGSSGGSTIIDRPTEKHPDIPTTSETKPVKPDKDGNITIGGDPIQDAINKANTDANKKGNKDKGIAVTVPVNNAADAGSLTITIPAGTLDKLVAAKVRRFDITTNGLPSFSFTLDTLKMLDEQSLGGDLILRLTKATVTSKQAKEAIGSRPAYDITLTFVKDGKETPFTDWQGMTVSVKLPYIPAKDEQGGNLYAVYVDANGKVEWLTKSSYNADQKAVIFEASHFSIYGVGYKNPAPVFTDITGHWAADNIIFVASRGLLAGTGNNQFSPNTGMTRGMFVTALGRLAGIDPESYKTGKFTDVKADAYYAPYVNWAAEKGIVSGTSATTFSPDTNITREQMAVIMANYAEKTGYDLPIAYEAVTFADNAQISSWAAKEVKAMQQAGIMAGKGSNRFDPRGTATRAEAATVLRRFVEIVIDPQTAQGWVQDHSGSWQYMKDGKAVTGWLYDDKKWYWLDKNGRMFAGGWKQISGKWYYFYSDGSMAVNTTIDGYTIGPDGARK